MSSHDFRDMLNLPGEARRPTKKQKLNGPKSALKGLAREIQNLNGDNPIAIVPEIPVFKKRRFGIRKPAAKWQLKPFKNTARDDQSLILKHWKRKAETPKILDVEYLDTGYESTIEDSIFAKFNVRIEVSKYDENQYQSYLHSPDWTKDETDYLMNLVEEYDLRWPVIWDRYNYQPPSSNLNSETCEATLNRNTLARSMEDLKERYYKVAAELMQLQPDKLCHNSHQSNQLDAMQKFNKQQEIARKKFAEASFHRTIEEAKEEENLLLELKRILARAEKLGHERKELYDLLDAPPSTSPIGAYTSSQGLQQLLASLVQADKAKRGKSLSRSSIVSATGSNQNSQSHTYPESRRDSGVPEMNSTYALGNKKVIQGSLDRRQLTSEEEVLFGVRYFDRITTTGPAFRHDKIMKLMVSKSSIQQAKINNVLSELRIPRRLLMPTYRVGEIFESLLLEISVLLELKKIADKLEGEINILKSLKAEREKMSQTTGPSEQHQKTCQEGDEDCNTTKLEAPASIYTDLKLDGFSDGSKEDLTTKNTHKRNLSTLSNQSLKRRKK